jgi:hypothetical protein
LGANAGIDPGTSGALFFDAFQSSRTSYIGAAANAQAITADVTEVDAADLNAYTEMPEPAEYTLEELPEPGSYDDTDDDMEDEQQLDESIFLPYLNRE